MLAEERRSQILEVLQDKGSVSVAELYRRLKVSKETIRRDIAKLAGERRLRKTHGGALSVDSREPDFSERMSQNIEGKRAIGQLAATLVSDGASLFIDSGTTTLCLAESLMDRHDLAVYTNDIHVAGKLAGRNGNRVVMLGGDLRGNEGAAYGFDTVRMVKGYLADIAFIGACAISPHPHLMDYARDAAEFRSQLIEQGRTAVVLADKTKFNKTPPVQVGGFEEISMIISDEVVPATVIRFCQKNGIETLVAGNQPA